MLYDAIRGFIRRRTEALDEPMVLIAESYSGPPAIEIAVENPDAIAALVLVSTFATAPAPRWLRPWISSAFFRAPAPASFVRYALMAPDSPGAIVRESQAALRRLDARVTADRIRQALRADVTARLDALTVPCLALFGRHDRVLRQPGSLATHPNVRVEHLDGPHALLTCRPAQCAETISAFLDSR
ncbi:MAG: serine aminopeptidase domain-containing protein [Myxococcota bacterium]